MDLKITVVFLLACLTSSSNADTSKLSPRLRNSLLEGDRRVNIFITVGNGGHGIKSILGDLALKSFATRASRSQAVFDALTQHSAETQKDVIAFVEDVARSDSSLVVKSFWITNQVYVQGATRNLIVALTTLDDVSHIDEEDIIHIDPPVSSEPAPARTSRANEWHLDTLGVPQVWADPQGNNGTGVLEQ